METVGMFTRLRLEKLAQDTCQSMYLTHKTGALNRISLRTEGLRSDRRANRLTTSTISHYVRRCRSSIGCYGTRIKAKIAVLCCIRRRASPRSTVVSRDRAQHQEIQYTSGSSMHPNHPTGSIASLTYNDAQSWKQ